MSHLFQQGFFVRQPAWHGLGTVVQDYPGIDEAMRLAGHDHEIECKPLMVVGGQQLAGWKALARKDTGAVISVMNSTYEVIQNRTPWEMIDQLFKAGAKFETAGILKGKFDENSKEVKGQVYWTLALLDEPEVIKGDNSPTYPYLASTWSHDGSQALRFRAMDVRIVCANTHHAAMYGVNGADLDVSIRHFGKVEARIQAATTAIRMARDAHKVYVAAANELAGIVCTDAMLELFIETIVPLPDAKLCTDRVRANVKASREEARKLFDGKTIAPAIRNTAYGMVEVGVEYFDHVRKSLSKDSYFTRNVMKVDAQKAGLVQTAREICLAV